MNSKDDARFAHIVLHSFTIRARLLAHYLLEKFGLGMLDRKMTIRLSKPSVITIRLAINCIKDIVYLLFSSVIWLCS